MSLFGGNRKTDGLLIMFYKSVHGYVAIQLPAYMYFDKPLRYTRHMHPLSFRQIHTAVSYYHCSFYPASVVLWNRLPSEVVLLEDLDSFREGVCKINHRSPELNTLFFTSFTIFLLILALTVHLHVILMMGVLQNG